jgi:nitrous oxide reductase accessory protein NosL
MKKIALATLLISGVLLAQMPMSNSHKEMKMPMPYQAVPFNKAEILQDGEAKYFCPKCGMSLPMFYKTNHAAKVDGKMQQFCSMHCLVEALNSGAKVTDIQVVDNSTLKFIPVEKAFYVVGSKKAGTMTKLSKYAFRTKEAAQKFAKEYGGKVLNFDEALKIAKEDFNKEQKMIAMKQAKMAQKGEMIYHKKCKEIKKKFDSVAQAKAYIQANNICPDVKGKALQAVGLYLYKR